MAEHGPFLRALSLFFSLSVRRQSLSPDCRENVAEISEKDERTNERCSCNSSVNRQPIGESYSRH